MEGRRDAFFDGFDRLLGFYDISIVGLLWASQGILKNIDPALVCGTLLDNGVV